MKTNQINKMFDLSVKYLNDYKIYVISEGIELIIKPTEITVSDNLIDFTYPGGVLALKIENIINIDNDERLQRSIVKIK